MKCYKPLQPLHFFIYTITKLNTLPGETSMINGISKIILDSLFIHKKNTKKRKSDIL